MKRKYSKTKTNSAFKKATKDLDTWFSRFIRLRDCREDGVGRCCTCTKPGYFMYADNGHFTGRQHRGTRWLEKNCALQCKPCNGFEEGLKNKFKDYLIERWGPAVLNEIAGAKTNGGRIDVFQMGVLTKYYEEKVYKLLGEKKIEKPYWVTKKKLVEYNLTKLY